MIVFSFFIGPILKLTAKLTELGDKHCGFTAFDIKIFFHNPNLLFQIVPWMLRQFFKGRAPRNIIWITMWLPKVFKHYHILNTLNLEITFRRNLSRRHLTGWHENADKLEENSKVHVQGGPGFLTDKLKREYLTYMFRVATDV